MYWPSIEVFRYREEKCRVYRKERQSLALEKKITCPKCEHRVKTIDKNLLVNEATITKINKIDISYSTIDWDW